MTDNYFSNDARNILAAMASGDHVELLAMGKLQFWVAMHRLEKDGYVARVETTPTGKYTARITWRMTGAGLDKLAELGVRWELEDPMPELLEGSHE